MQALGFIETRSLTASIEASDVMTKTADVWVVGTEAVTAAVKAGEAVAKEIGEVYAVNVIPRPHDDIAKILPSI